MTSDERQPRPVPIAGAANLTVGQLLRQLRRRSGLRQAELAKRLGVAQSTVSAAEKSTGSLNLQLMLAYCEQLDIRLEVSPSGIQALGHLGPGVLA